MKIPLGLGMRDCLPKVNDSTSNVSKAARCRNALSLIDRHLTVRRSAQLHRSSETMLVESESFWGVKI
jgi:hypothetical protein